MQGLVPFVLLLILSFVLAIRANPSSFCVAVNSQIDELPGPLDGISTKSFSDFSWVIQQCSSNSGSSIHYNSGWISQMPSTLQLHFLPLPYEILSFQIQRRLDATLENENFNISIVVSFQIRIQFRFSQVLYNTSFSGEISKKTSSFPFAASSNFPVGWRAWIDSPKGSNPLIRDVNLFDGALPSVIFSSQTSFLRSQNMSNDILSFFLSDAANVNIRLNSYRSQPSVLRSPLRGVFLSPEILYPYLSQSQIEGYKLVIQRNATVKKGLIVQSRGICRGLSCPSNVLTVLNEVVLSTGINRVCSTLKLLNQTVESFLSADLFVDEDNLTLQGLSAETRALFQCMDSAQGFIGLRLSVTGSSSIEWPIEVFLIDPAARISLIKSLPLTPSGRIYGSVTTTTSNRNNNNNYDHQLYTVIRSDIFSSSRGGFLISDVPLSPRDAVFTIGNIFIQILRLLQTGTSLDRVLVDLLPIQSAKLSELVSEYFNITQTPSLGGFLQWFVSKRSSSLQLYLNSNGDSATLSIQSVQRTTIREITDTVVNQTNAAIQDFVEQIHTQFPTTRSLPSPVISNLTQLSLATFESTLVASVRIDGLGSSSNSRSVTVNLTSKSFHSVARVTAQWDPNINATFSRVSVVLDTSRSLPTIVGESSHALRLVLGADRVGRDTKGNLILANPFNNIQPRNFISFLHSTIERIRSLPNSNWIYQPLYPLKSNVALFTDQLSLESLLLECIQILQSLPSTMDPVTFGWQLANNLSSLSTSNALISANIMPAYSTSMSSSSLTMELVAHRLTWLTISEIGTEWKTDGTFIGISRLTIPILLTVEFQSQLNGTDDVEISVSVQGNSQLNDWTVPVMYSMSHFSVQRSEVLVSIGLPNQANFSMNIDCQSTFDNKTLSIQVIESNLNDQRHPSITWSFSSTESLVQPKTVFTGLKQTLLTTDSILKETINLPVPPLLHPLSELFPWQRIVNSRFIPLLSEPNSVPNGLLTSSYVCASHIQFPLTLHVTLNQNVSVPCEVQAKNGSSLLTVTSALQQSLVACHLSQFLRVRFDGFDNNNPDCGTISFYSTVPGIVWYLIIDGGPFSSSFTSFLDPSFATWDDLTRWLFVGLGTPLQRPQLQWIRIDDVPGLIPPELRNFYPNLIQAVVVDLDFKNQMDFFDWDFPSNKQPLNHSELVSQDEGVGFTLQNGTGTILKTGQGFHCRLGVVVDVPGPNRLTLSSNLDGENSTLNSLVFAPNNTFDLEIEFENRTDQRGVHSKVKVSIILPSGVTFQSAMMQYLPPQIPEEIKPMFSVSVQPGNEILDTTNQTLLSISRVQVNQGRSWLLPLSFSIKNSTVPYLENATNEPTTAVLIVSNMTLQNSLSYNVTIDSTRGFVGIGKVKRATGFGRGDLQVIIKQNHNFDMLMSVLSLVRQPALFFSNFTVDLNFLSDLSFTSLEFEIIRLDLPNAPSVELYLNLDKQLQSYDDYIATIREFRGGWNVSFENGPRFSSVTSDVLPLKSLANLRTESLCSWTNTSMNFLSLITEMSEALRFLPFSPRTIKDLVNSGFLNSLNTVYTSICQNEFQQEKLDHFCREMQLNWPSLSCTAFLNRTLFGLEITATFSFVWHDQFHLDMQHMFGTVEVPNIFGTTSSVEFVANFSFTLPFFAELTPNGGVQLFIGQHISFLIAAGFQFSGQLNAYLGPLKLTLANTDFILGSPVTIQILYNNNNNNNNNNNRRGISRMDVVSVDRSLSKNSVLLLVNGQAKFDSEILVFGEPICWINIVVPQLQSYLSGQTSPIISTQHCGEGFVNTLKNKMKDNPILKFFSDPALFMTQLQHGFLSFDSLLFGNNGLIRNLVLPLVDTELTVLIRRAAIDKIIGPATSRELIGALTDMINNIIFNHKFTFNQTNIEKLVLTGVTEVLCRVLKPTTCPPVPTPGSQDYSWTMVYEREIVNQPIAKLNFALGQHGIVSLQLNCTLQLLLEYHFAFTIRYSKMYGIQIIFPEEPESIFSGVARLDLNPTDCQMEGEIGFLAAELYFSPGSQFEATIRVSKSKTNRWNANVELLSQLLAVASLGISPSLSEKFIHAQDPIRAIPHFEGKMSFSWHWTLQDRPTAPVLHFTDFQFCLGSLLSHLIADIAQRCEIALGPMQKILGPNGLLLQKIEPTKYIFGRTLTVAEALQIIVQDFCRGECVFKNVIEALKTFQKYYSQIEVLQSLIPALEHDNGCGVFQIIRNFSANFSTPQVEIIWTGPLPPSDLQFKPGVLSEHERLKAAEFYSYCTVKTEGKWGLHWLVTSKDIPKTIIQLILGKDVALLEFTIPGLVISAGAHWGVPVWSFPYVELGVEVIATLKAELGGILFTTAGIRQLIQTGNVGHIWNSLAIRTVHDDGSPIRQLEGSVTLGGYVYVSVFIFDGSASVFLHLSAGISIADVNHVGYVTFDQFFFLLRQGFNKAFTIYIRLEAGFDLRLRACLIFKCWTVVSIDRRFPLWGRDFDSTAGQLDAVATPQMDPNLNVVHTLTAFSLPSSQHLKNQSLILPSSTAPPPRFVLIADPADPSVIQIAFSPSPTTMQPPLSRIGSKQTSISFVGSAQGMNFDYYLYGVPQTVIVPGITTGVHLFASSYDGATQFVITPQSLVMDVSFGEVQFPQGCRQLMIKKLFATSSIETKDGLPCALFIDADITTNITLSGRPRFYTNRPISVSNAFYTLQSKVEVTTLNIWSTSLQADNGTLNVSFPDGVTQIILGCHPQQNCTFIHHESNGTVKLVGGDAWDSFICTSIDRIHGMLYWKGNGGVNFGYVTLPTSSSSGMNAVIAPNSIVYRNTTIRTTSSLFTIAMEEIQVKNVRVLGAPQARSEVVISTIEPGGVVNLNVLATPSSEVIINATGCDSTGNAYIQLSGGGIQTVIFSSANQLSYFGCTFHIYGSDEANETDIILIKASAELRRLDWEFYKGGIRIIDLVDTRNSFWIIYQNIERLMVEFSHTASSRVIVFDGTYGTEAVFMFPRQSASNNNNSNSNQNDVTVCRTTNALLINGSFALHVGPTKNRCNFLSTPSKTNFLFSSLFYNDVPLSDNPLNDLGGQLIVVNSFDPIVQPIQLHSGRNGSQYFAMNSLELNPLDEHFNVPPLISPPSPWMCQLCIENGIPLCSRAHLVYKGNFHLYLTTGSGADYFEGTNVSIPVDVVLQNGNDIVHWKSTSQQASFDLGVGLDEFDCHVPIGPTVVWNGDDNDPDLTRVVYEGNIHPNWQPPIIGPVGPHNNDKITLNQYRPPEDIVQILVNNFKP